MTGRISTLFLFGAALMWAQPRLSSVTPNGVEVRIDAPQGIDLLSSHAEVDLESYYPGALLIGEPGGPALPRYRIVLGVPPEGKVHLDYSFGPARELQGVRLSTYKVPAIGPQPAPVPDWADTLSPVTFHVTHWRDFRVAVIEVTPLRYSYADRKLTLYDGVTLNVSFDSSTDVKTPAPLPDTRERIYSSTLLNYDQCKDWRLSLAQKADPFEGSANWVKVTIPQDGIYRISFQDLKKLGVDASRIDPRTLRLLYPGERGPEDPFPDTLSELPIYVHGAEDGSFDSYDYVVFFGRGANRWSFAERRFKINPFVRENVYWLTWGGKQGLRMLTRAAYPADGEALTTARTVLHFEEDHECPGRSGLLWLWRAIKKSTVPERDSFLIDLSGVTRIDTFTLRGYADSTGLGFRVLVGTDTLDYRTSISGGVIGNPDYSVVSPEIPLSNEWQVVIEVFGPGQRAFYPDWIRMVVERELSFRYTNAWFELDGRHTYLFDDLKTAPFLIDISNPADPVLLTDWEIDNGKLKMSPRIDGVVPVWVSRDIKSPSLENVEPGSLWREDWAVDYLILSTTTNLDAAQAFADYRSEHLGIPGVSSPKVKAVDVAEIVRDFGYGLAEPQAVRHFLSYAYRAGGGRPFYALILGDGTYDYKNNLNYSGLPEYFIIHTQGYVIDPNVYATSGYTDDSWFVEFDEPGEFMPEMTIARITARDSREALVVLDKIKKYESSPPGAWDARVLLLSDDFYLGTPSIKDDIDNHVSANEALAELLSPEFDPVKVYLSDYAYSGGRKPEAEKALLQALDQGALLWFFFGHGKGDQLTHEAVFTTPDIPKVHNENRLPVALFCSCGVGRFEDTRWESLAEELARGPEGAIATIAATKGTGARNNERLADSLARTFRNLKQTNLGDLFFAVTTIDNLYILFGDPATPILFPTERSFSSTIDEFVTGDTAEISFVSPLEEGYWFASAYGSWIRKTDPAKNASYDYKGNLYYRAHGELGSDTQALSFIVPLDTAQGYNAYLHVVCADDDSIYTYRLDSILVKKGSGTSSDHKGPLASFFANGLELVGSDTVPRSFTLTVELEDPSGINLTGLAGLGVGTNKPFSLVINEGEPIDLAPYFEYEVIGDALATGGSANIPLSLSSEENDLILYAVDNLRNLSQYELKLYTSFARTLKISEPLVYPNPVSSDAMFTFDLNASAEVSIQIFTVSGRLVRKLPAVQYQAGFGTYYWDGFDADSRPLPNGVYVYRLTAESTDALLPNARASVNEKFIVVH